MIDWIIGVIGAAFVLGGFLVLIGMIVEDISKVIKKNINGKNR